jgi:AcrR family transcriptional regulator
MRVIARIANSRSGGRVKPAKRSTARARKAPKQARSRELVETILTAAARVFVRRGYAHATTNRIAEAAGVSVGSLYQYFPSKDAIAVELLRRYRARLLELVAAHLATIEATSLEAAVRGLLVALLRAEGIDPALHRVLIEQVLRTDARAELLGFEERLEHLLGEVLARTATEVRARDLEIVSFVVVRVVLAMIHAVVVDRPTLDRARVADELTRLVVGYLEGT